MIQKQTTINTTSSGIDVQKAFGMNSDDMPHIFKILRNNIYSNKPLAVLREYFCNMIDAHVMVDQVDIPGEITFPSAFDLNLKFRDFGPGLSEQDVYDIFTKYGASTKRNNSSTMGCLGIGSKSAFCMTNNFTVVSYYGGFKTTYLCHLDQTGLGLCSKLEQQMSSAPNGVEIIVPVKHNEINSFVEEAKKLFVWSKVKPVIYGNEELANYVRGFKLDVVRSSSNWRLYNIPCSYLNYGHNYLNYEIICLMGNIPYPINLQHFDRYNPKHAFFMKSGVGLVIEVELGAVSFSANRETLEYDKDTVAYLHKCLENVYDEIEAEFNKALAQAPTYWDALIRYGEYSQYFGAIKPTYKGNVISNDSYVIENEQSKKADGGSFWSDMVRCYNYTNRYSDIKKGSIRPERQAYICPSKKPVLFMNKGDFPESTLRDRFFYYCEANNIDPRNTGCTIITITDDTKRAEFLARPELDGTNFIDMADIIVLPKIRKKPIYKTVDKSKIQILKYNGSTLYPYSNCWDEAKVDKTDKIIYVRIEKYAPMSDKIGDFNNKLGQYKYHFKDDIVVYGVKKDVKVPSHWVEYSDYIKEKIQLKIKSSEFKKYHQAKKFFSDHINVDEFKPEKLDSGLFKNYVLKCAEMLVHLNTAKVTEFNSYERVANLFKIPVNDTYPTSRALYLEKILNRYPLLKFLRTWVVEDVTEYINYID